MTATALGTAVAVLERPQRLLGLTYIRSFVTVPMVDAWVDTGTFAVAAGAPST